MKRHAVILALIVSVIASPLAGTATKPGDKVAATTTERGVGTGVTEKIAPPGGPPPKCNIAYNGKFGIAVQNITTNRKDVAPAAAALPVPVPTQVKPALASAETTPPPPAAVGPDTPPNEFGVITKQSTRTHTRTVTVRRTVVGQEVKASVYMISQIGDGQIQAPTAPTLLQRTTFGAAVSPPAAATPASPKSTVGGGAGGGLVSEIGDGQIQAPKPAATGAAASPKPVVAAPPSVPPPAAAPPAAAPPAAAPPKAVTPPAPADPMAGMDMSPKPAAAPAPMAGMDMTGMNMAGMNMKEKRQAASDQPATQFVACQTAGTLSMTLQDGVLKDDKGRTGYIASNYQFQFDAPPQSGSIYTAGFSVCNNGSLALGGSTTWYQCRSGDFYNLYDRWWAPQCNPVTINAVMLKQC